MSTILRPRLKAQAFTDTWQVEIVDLTGIYVRNAGRKSTAILDGAELCRVEEFAARHFRRSGFEATFLESEPFGVLFGVYLWSVIQDRGDRQVRTVGIMAHPGYAHGESSEVIWIPLPSDFGTPAYSRRRAMALIDAQPEVQIRIRAKPVRVGLDHGSQCRLFTQRGLIMGRGQMFYLVGATG